MDILPALDFDTNTLLLRTEILQLMQFYNMHKVPSPEVPYLDVSKFYLAIHEGMVVGAAGYEMKSATQGKTTLMSVHPRMKGKGIGKKLQQARMDKMKELGATSVITNADRPASIAWYKKHFGYVEIGKLKKLHPFGLPNISYWTTLRTTIGD